VANKTEILLRELIALPSVNPAFLAGPNTRAGERRISEFLAAKLGSAGLDIEFQPVLTGRSNLLARLSPAGKTSQRILLAPHLDTVDGSEGQFIPRKKDGRLFGRGACDTKGSIAAMVSALIGLAESKQRPTQTEIWFAGLVDEENVQSGSRVLAASGFHADLAIVGEPTRLQVVTAHKGSLWLELETRGKSAHGARPELGVNAVHLMAQVVDLLETEYASKLRGKRHALLGSPTVNVGMIRGGTQANIVPDRCTILVDRRTVPGETEASVLREMKSLLVGQGLKASIRNAKAATGLPLETDPRTKWVAKFLKSAAQRKPAGVHYFCDASVLSQADIPSVVFGPGDIAQAHTADEWISLESLEKARAMLLLFLRSLP
jgi:acetylornithine deacetylase/succinyl-diaminopimelate desuccinylase family protein